MKIDHIQIRAARQQNFEPVVACIEARAVLQDFAVGKRMTCPLQRRREAFKSRLPITAYYVVVITVALWIVLEYTPIGRYLNAIGANQRAAELNGIPTRKFVIGAFVTSGLMTALAGVLLAAKLRIGQASVGLEFLLPALVGPFLGSTTIKPGRVNVWGTIVGVMILAVGISGIQQFGGSFWVEPMFNGATLLIAIGIAGYAQRKKGAKS